MIEGKTIAKALVALVCLAAVFAVGLFVGRTGGAGDFSVTTQYAVGAMDEAELSEINRRVEERAAQAAAEMTSETEQGSDVAEVSDSADAGLININTADAQTLQLLPGIGPAIAERIIAHRETYGAFRIIEEITDVSGIGEARFADIRDQITVE